jgi:hypothetical protein
MQLLLCVQPLQHHTMDAIASWVYTNMSYELHTAMGYALPYMLQVYATEAMLLLVGYQQCSCYREAV